MKAGIAGAGIMGRLLALALHNAGWQVTLFDHVQENNCSAAAAGLLTPVSELDKADWVIFHLGQDSVKTHWPRILEQLPEPIYFNSSGTLVLNHPDDHMEWTHFRRRIATRLDSERVYYQHVSRDKLMQLEPSLDKFESAWYFPDEAQIDCQSLLIALKKYLQTQSVKFIVQSVTLLEPHLIITQEETHEFDVVFDCRGMGAGGVFADLRPLRGELIELHAPDVQLTRPIRFLHPRYSLYIAPRPGQVYLIGASEIEAEDYSPISVRTTLELLTAAWYVHPGFAEARIMKTVTHCRPTLANHLPRIQYRHGLIAINGLYRHGFLVAPTLANDIVRALNTGMNHVNYPELWENYHDTHLSE